MNEEMSKPRFSGYDIAGAVVPGVAAAQGMKSAYKKYKSKKDSEGTSEISTMSQMASEMPKQELLTRRAKMADKAPKIDLRKSYPE